MDKHCAVTILALLTLLSLTGCSATEEPASQPEPEEGLEEGLGEIVISEDDISPEIGTLPSTAFTSQESPPGPGSRRVKFSG